MISFKVPQSYSKLKEKEVISDGNSNFSLKEEKNFEYSQSIVNSYLESLNKGDISIKSFKLKNFRQFKNVDLEFSQDTEKPFTIITGGNTYGKTTLVKSFLWCMYGQKLFDDKNLYAIPEQYIDIIGNIDPNMVKYVEKFKEGNKLKQQDSNKNTDSISQMLEENKEEDFDIKLFASKTYKNKTLWKKQNALSLAQALPAILPPCTQPAQVFPPC